MEEMTKVQQLVEIASWAKKQPAEFTKHFKTMRSILRVYRELPADYDKKKSVVAYIKKNLNKDCSKWDCYLAHRSAERLALIFNTIFGVRYFKDAPHRFVLRLGLNQWKSRSGELCMEVRCSPYDRCNIYDNFNGYSMAASMISIKSVGDAKRAAAQLLASEVKSHGDDYEVEYASRLKEAMKISDPSDEELVEGIEVVL